MSESFGLAAVFTLAKILKIFIEAEFENKVNLEKGMWIRLGWVMN